MEKLAIYDEYMRHIGCEDRDIVHQKGLWHKTVHCWLYDDLGNIYFQIRKSSQKLYTTASGHVQAGESVKQAFRREVMEEIGIKVDIENSLLVEITAWRMDKIKNDQPFIDRAFANVYLNKVDDDKISFVLCEDEVSGLVKVNATDCLKLLYKDIKEVPAEKITTERENISLTADDFLVQQGEIAIVKYGKILQEVIKLTKH